MILFKIAWRNLWRNTRRSIIILCSIVVGVISVLITDAVGNGFIVQMINNQINSHVAHIQINKKGFEENKIIENYLPNKNKVEQILQTTEGIEGYSSRVLSFGLIRYASNSSGATLVGVDPQREKQLTDIHSLLVDGEYLSGKRNEILLSQRMAENLDVEVGSNLVGMSTQLDGSVGMDAFRVVGIFRTSNSEFDKAFVFIQIEDAQKMLGLGENITQFAVRVDNPDLAFPISKELQKALGNEYEALSYNELLPMLMSFVEIYRSMIWIFYAIIAIAVLFGIVNTMLMAVFERINEIGVLMAIGMRNSKIFIMFLYEAFSLGTLGTIIGFVIGIGMFYPLSVYGIDLSAFADGMESWGLGSTIYPIMNVSVVFNSLVFMPIATVIGAIYPASKAIRLQPTEAIRYV